MQQYPTKKIITKITIHFYCFVGLARLFGSFSSVVAVSRLDIKRHTGKPQMAANETNSRGLRIYNDNYEWKIVECLTTKSFTLIGINEGKKGKR